MAETAVPMPEPSPAPRTSKVSVLPGRLSEPSTRVVAASLRAAQVVLSFVALIVMATASDCGLDFSYFRAFEYLVAAMALQLAWSLGMLVAEQVMLRREGSLAGGRIFSMTRFAGDFIILVLSLSAFSAAAGVSTTVFRGDYCDGCGSFCSQTEAATAMAFFAFMAEAFSFLLAAFVYFTFLM